MSLINEALKKAQKQRTGEAPSLSSLPSIGGERPVHIARRQAPPGFNALLLRLGLGIGALAILGVGGFLLFRGKETASPAPSAPVPVSAAPATTPVATAPSPAPATPAVPAPAPMPASTFVVPNVTAPAQTSPAPAKPASVTAQPKTEPSKPETVATVTAPTPAPVVEQPQPAPVRAPAAPRKLEPRAINFIEAIRVAGIRASATDSKVLMNDRVYRVGDMVEHEMGLKLVGISSSSLTFEDDQGGRYTRNF
jgi:hypothetical protein